MRRGARRAVFATGYADTLSLIRDGERGLERAARRRARATPWPSTGSSRRSPTPARSSAPGSTTAATATRSPAYVFPDEVVWDFIKLASAIIGPGEDIVIPPNDDVIKRVPATPRHSFASTASRSTTRSSSASSSASGRRTSRAEDALDHIFGYTVFNDVGSRSVQFHNGQTRPRQELRHVLPDGAVHRHEGRAARLGGVRIQSHVNGEQRQDALVGEQIGPPPVAIEWLTSIITLEPGDCLMTGTPAGCGTFMDPAGVPRARRHGHRAPASGIGELTNPVVAGTAGHTNHAASTPGTKNGACRSADGRARHSTGGRLLADHL